MILNYYLNIFFASDSRKIYFFFKFCFTTQKTNKRFAINTQVLYGKRARESLWFSIYLYIYIEKIRKRWKGTHLIDDHPSWRKGRIFSLIDWLVMITKSYRIIIRIYLLLSYVRNTHTHYEEQLTSWELIMRIDRLSMIK